MRTGRFSHHWFNFAYWVILYAFFYVCWFFKINFFEKFFQEPFSRFFFVVCWFFQNQLFLKNSFRNTFRVSNSLDPDQAWRFVGPDLGPNCLQRLSADKTSRQRATNSSTRFFQWGQHYFKPLSCHNFLAWKCHLLFTSAAYSQMHVRLFCS